MTERTLKLDIQVELDERSLRALKQNPGKVFEVVDAALARVRRDAVAEIVRRLGEVDA